MVSDETKSLYADVNAQALGYTGIAGGGPPPPLQGGSPTSCIWPDHSLYSVCASAEWFGAESCVGQHCFGSMPAAYPALSDHSSGAA